MPVHGGPISYDATFLTSWNIHSTGSPSAPGFIKRAFAFPISSITGSLCRIWSTSFTWPLNFAKRPLTSSTLSPGVNDTCSAIGLSFQMRISMMTNGKFDDGERVGVRERNRVNKYATLSRWSSLHLLFAKRRPLKFDPMSPVKNPVQDRIGDGRLL